MLLVRYIKNSVMAYLDKGVVQGGRDSSGPDGITIGASPSDMEWMR
jgi:hypothetical protein